MLLPAQVVPFLLHSQSDVRELALRYLSQAHDPSPATADDLWRAIDRFGGKESSIFYDALSSLPQTEQSIVRTLKALEAEKDPIVRDCLQDVLAELTFGLLMRFRDDIEQSPGLSDELRKHLEQRTALASKPAAELWEQLMEFARQQSNGNKSEGEKSDDWLYSRRLVEALSRRPEAAQWAIAVLNDPAIADRREVYAVELLGWMRHRQSAQLLVDKMASDEEAGALADSCAEALVRIGSADVVRLIHQQFAQMTHGVRLRAAEVLGRIKLPSSESAVRDLIGREPDRSIRTCLARALCVLCANEPASLERLRNIIKDGDWNRTMVELDMDVVALFTMVGHDVPELHVWRARSADHQARQAGKIRQSDRFLADSSKVIRHSQEELAPEEDQDPPSGEAGRQTVQTSDFASPKTYRRQTPKIGRNDPCPCGSGKKYKKCCGK